MNSYNKKVRKYPFIVSIIYLISTVVIYFTGEYIWDIPSKAKLLAFLLVAYLCYYLGGLLGLKSKIKSVNKNKNKISVSMVHLFRISCFFSIIAYVVMVNYYGHGFFSLNSFASLGYIYIEKALRDEYQKNYLVQICSWFWIFTYFYIPIGITYYRKLKK